MEYTYIYSRIRCKRNLNIREKITVPIRKKKPLIRVINIFGPLSSPYPGSTVNLS